MRARLLEAQERAAVLVRHAYLQHIHERPRSWTVEAGHLPLVRCVGDVQDRVPVGSHVAVEAELVGLRADPVPEVNVARKAPCCGVASNIFDVVGPRGLEDDLAAGAPQEPRPELILLLDERGVAAACLAEEGEAAAVEPEVIGAPAPAAPTGSRQSEPQGHTPPGRRENLMRDARNVLHVSLFVPEAAGEAGARVVASVKIDPKLEPLSKQQRRSLS